MLKEAPETVKRLLCESWCSELDVADEGDSLRLSMPLLEPDGDHVTVWLRQVMGGWRIEDAGSTLMRFSYDSDSSALTRGPRRVMLDSMLAEYGARLDEDGQIVAETEERDIGGSLLRYGQAMLRVNDLRAWSRPRVASTFFDDLKMNLVHIVGANRVIENYLHPLVPDAADYPIDFAIDGAPAPLFVFGVPTKERARLATIVLQHLDQYIDSFDAIVVFQDASQIPSGDLRRLMNAANDMVDSIDARGALEKKIRHRLKSA